MSFRSVLLAGLRENRARQRHINASERRRELEEEISDLEAEIAVLEEELDQLGNGPEGPDQEAEYAQLQDEERRILAALDGKGVVVVPES